MSCVLAVGRSCTVSESRHINKGLYVCMYDGWLGVLKLYLHTGCVFSTQAMLAFERAIRADKTFEKAIIALSSLYIHDNDTERAAQL